MIDQTPTGPALAEALGGTFDLDNGTVRFEGRDYFVRCATTGKVQLITHVLDSGALGSAPVNLGMMSEGVDTLAKEFVDTLVAARLPHPTGISWAYYLGL